jgi:hypothetical protein|tara:strand:- start:9782 stop:10405 length:624 start_codon:yes stop_codon:yes gene_type:complete
MGVCVSVHTVERALADEAEIERRSRVDALARSLANNKGELYLHGVLARCDRVNRNGRVYPKPILHREVAAYVAARVRRGRAYGKLEHPAATNEAEFRDADDETRACCRVVDVYWCDGDRTLMGYVKILDTESGRAIREIYEGGGLVGASTRSWSSLETRADGKCYVDDDLELLAFDLVRDPATISLSANGLLTPVRGAVEGRGERLD